VKLNIVRKHDDRFRTNALFQSASAARGYSASGLEAQSAIKPFLCASCHGSNALSLAGYAGVPALTTSMHGLHSTATDPATNQSLESATTRDACYHCHPGPKTQCVRGAMGNLKTTTGTNAVECQSCHGTMSTLAVATRQGWLNEPAWCEACHGSTHAEFPTTVANDNVQSTTLQGHAGTLAECASCHGTVPNTVTGGSHGLHPIGTSWVNSHQDVAGGNQASCQPCHGTDYRGTIPSKTRTDRTLAGKSFPSGTVIGCYSCHNGPN
jgi:hypothetical protein